MSQTQIVQCLAQLQPESLYHESSHRFATVTGGLLGIAMGGLAVNAVTESWIMFAAASIILLAYLGIATAALAHAGAWKRVVAEHFP